MLEAPLLYRRVAPALHLAATATAWWTGLICCSKRWVIDSSVSATAHWSSAAGQ